VAARSRRILKLFKRVRPSPAVIGDRSKHHSRSHMMLFDLPKFLPCLLHQRFKIISALRVQPESRRCSEKSGQLNRGVGGNPSPSLGNRVYSGRIYENPLGEGIQGIFRGRRTSLRSSTASKQINLTFFQGVLNCLPHIAALTPSGPNAHHLHQSSRLSP